MKEKLNKDFVERVRLKVEEIYMDNLAKNVTAHRVTNLEKFLSSNEKEQRKIIRKAVKNSILEGNTNG